MSKALGVGLELACLRVRNFAGFGVYWASDIKACRYIGMRYSGLIPHDLRKQRPSHLEILDFYGLELSDLFTVVIYLQIICISL
jgi:hypothetical protein